MLIKFLSKHREPLSPIASENPEHEATFWSENKKLNANIFVRLFLSDLDKKITSASHKRERNKNKAEPNFYLWLSGVGCPVHCYRLKFHILKLFKADMSPRDSIVSATVKLNKELYA